MSCPRSLSMSAPVSGTLSAPPPLLAPSRLSMPWTVTWLGPLCCSPVPWTGPGERSGPSPPHPATRVWDRLSPAASSHFTPRGRRGWGLPAHLPQHGPQCPVWTLCPGSPGLCPCTESMRSELRLCPCCSLYRADADCHGVLSPLLRPPRLCGNPQGHHVARGVCSLGNWVEADPGERAEGPRGEGQPSALPSGSQWSSQPSEMPHWGLMG